MKRRQLLLGSGATLGGASILGTGAFTSVSAERGVSVAVAADADAFLRLAPCPNSPNGDYVTDAESGTLAIDLSDSNESVNGDGINHDAVSRFDKVFEIANQGTQSVCVDFEVEVPDIEVPVPDSYNFEQGDPAVVFYRGSDPGRYVINNVLDTDRGGAIKLPIDNGNSECIGFEVRAFGFGSGEDLFSGVDLTIRADADAECTLSEPGAADSVPRIPGPTDGLVGYWPLDDLSDGTAEDAVGGNDGALSGGVSTVSGKLDGAAAFDGNDDYVNVPDDSSLDITEALTLTAWVKPSASQDSYARIISREQSGAGNRQYNVGVDASATEPRTVVDTAEESGVEVSAAVPFTDNSWQHAVVTFDASDAVRLYIDGTEEASTSVSSSLVSRSSTVKFGAPAHLPDKDFFTGRIDDVRIYNRVLSGSEVSNLYNDTN